MASGTTFSVLGDLEVRDQGVPLRFEAPKLKVVLAALIVRSNQIVPQEDLAPLLWPDQDRGTATLRSYAMRLRRNLGGLGDRMETVRGGYRLVLDEESELDLRRFTTSHRAGQAAADTGDWSAAAAHLDLALSLWRGAPYSGIACPELVDHEAPALHEQHRQARELRCRADLELARYTECAAELRRLIHEDPLRESAYALLMRVLAATGRRGEAFALHGDLRTRLRNELGVDPGPEVQCAHLELLGSSTSESRLRSGDRPRRSGGPRPTSSPSTSPSTSPMPASAPVPDQELPAGVNLFTGREGEVDRLKEILSPGGTEPRRTAVVVLTGMGGVGKTALALHTAWQLAAEFPGGRYCLHLRGSDPDSRRDQGDLLGEMLGLLKAEPDDGRDGVENRGRRVRELLSARRRTLWVLDDAADAAHLRALLPRLAGAGVIATSRNHLTALPDATYIAVEPMDRDSSRLLATRILGRDRSATEPAAFEEMLELCSDLPLAVRVAGSALATRPRWRIADFTARLHEVGRRLDCLSFGDSSVRRVFELSYQTVRDEVLRRAFCLVGPIGEVGLTAAAALLGRTESEAEELLEQLVEMSLLQSPAPDRYRAHDLIAEFAAEKAETELSQTDREAALLRLLTWYACAAEAASSRAEPGRVVEITVPAECSDLPPVPRFADGDRAIAWVEREEDSLRGAARRACTASDPQLLTLCWQLPTALWGIHMRRRRIPALVELHECALTALAAVGDETAEARIRNNLGIAYSSSGQPSLAVPEFSICLDIRSRLGDAAGQARARHNLIPALFDSGDAEAAVTQLRLQLAYTVQIADPQGTLRAMINLGNALAITGDLAGALATCESAESLADTGSCVAADRLQLTLNKAEVLESLGRLPDSVTTAESAARQAREFGDRHGLLAALRTEARVRAALGDPGADRVRDDIARLERELG